MTSSQSKAGDVACGQEKLTAREFEKACGVSVGTSVPDLPTDDAISAMVRQWLNMPPPKQ